MAYRPTRMTKVKKAVDINVDENMELPELSQTTSESKIQYILENKLSSIYQFMTSCMNPKSITVRKKKSQAQKSIFCLIPFIYKRQN